MNVNKNTFSTANGKSYNNEMKTDKAPNHEQFRTSFLSMAEPSQWEKTLYT